MASRLKKLLHTKKDEQDSPEHSEQDTTHARRRLSKSGGHIPATRPSLDNPDTVGGGYSPTGNTMSGKAGPQSRNYARGDVASSSEQGYEIPPARQQGELLSSEFSKMNLEGSRNQASHSDQMQAVSQDYVDSLNPNSTGIRRVEAEDPRLQSSGHYPDASERQSNFPPQSSEYTLDSAYATQEQGQEQDLARKRSIPRKEVGTGKVGHSMNPTISSATPSTHKRQTSSQKPLPTAPYEQQERRINETRAEDMQPQTRNGAYVHDGLPSADEVITRAKDNTYDTEVIEAIAPAVVHETVNREIHHIRHEVITRDIHEHEYYHRILPVIDVEVLPPRHFLPVEGGGLVEISADEVPGRGRNWVIAETASKIPSGEALPVKPNRFSARDFTGDEGDEKKYMTSEGFERTETTWVHPPELETGARETGQTWPMEFGKKQRPQSPGKAGKQRGILKQPGQRSAEEQRMDGSADM